MQEALFTAALGIESPWFVESVAFNSTQKRLDIHLSFKRGSRFEVNGDRCPVHDTVAKSWRHLNFFEHECYLHARVPRVNTPDGQVLLVMPPWSGKLSGFTLLFEALLIGLSRHMPVHQVAKMTHVSDFKLWRMLDVYVYAARWDEDWSGVTAIGMDETSLAKGHEYITLFVDLVHKRTLYITEGKDSKTVKDFVETLDAHYAEPLQIKDVSCDMSSSFIKGVNDYLPKASVTFDRFHITKIINEGVDAVRREEAKTTPLLKKARYVFLKNQANLNAKEKAKREELQLSTMNLKSMEALRMRENFQAIYQAATMEHFSALLKEWIEWVEQCGLKPMEKVAHCMCRHWDGIVQWKKSQINNGILEGLNSVIQAAKRKARGYKTKHFITIAYLITAKLDFEKLNPHCKPT